MFITLTRFEVDPQRPPDRSRFEAAGRAAREDPGWRGAMLFRSADDPKTMMRITMWADRDARVSFQASDAARALGLGQQPGQEHWQLVSEERPD